jgi:hypothetical protein
MSLVSQRPTPLANIDSPYDVSAMLPGLESALGGGYMMNARCGSSNKRKWDTELNASTNLLDNPGNAFVLYVHMFLFC